MPIAWSYVIIWAYISIIACNYHRKNVKSSQVGHTSSFCPNTYVHYVGCCEFSQPVNGCQIQIPDMFVKSIFPLF